MDGLSSEGLVLLGALASIQLAQGKSAEDLGLLAAFFTIIGDNLALLALAAPTRDSLEGGPSGAETIGTDTPQGPVVVP